MYVLLTYKCVCIIDRSALKFITWTSTDITATNELCVLPPDIAIKVAAKLGFSPVDYETLSAEEAESRMLNVCLSIFL